MQDYTSKIKIFLILISPFTIYYSLFTREALAHCPLCVVGAGAGLGISRYLGIDDSITGVWLAAVLGAVALWTDTWLRAKLSLLSRVSRSLTRPFVYLLFFLLSLFSFYQAGWMDEHVGTIFGFPKLAFGVVSGGVLFYLIDIADDWLIKRYGKVFFPYQRIVVSLGAMVLLSLAIFILINYYI